MLGYLDETWWSRLARPTLQAWADPTQPLRLVEQTRSTADPDPTALACYGRLLRQHDQPDELLLRFVTGRPLSVITTQFLAWSCEQLAAQGKTALLLVWDNASWHVSQQVRTWIRQHNRHVKQTGQGVRIVVCCLPVKSPWLNPIEPKWLHGKRQVVEPDRLLTAQELADRVCEVFGCPHHDHLVLPKEVS